MSDTLTIMIPGHAPTVNHQYQHTAHGHYLTDAARAWLERTGYETLIAHIQQHWRDPGGPLTVVIEHNATRQDVDGCQKIVMDAVFRALDINDRRVTECTVRRATFDGPCVRVQVDAAKVKELEEK